MSLGFPRNVTDKVVSNFLLLTSIDAVWKNASVFYWHICETIFQPVKELRENNMIQFCNDTFAVNDLQLDVDDLELNVDEQDHLTDSDNPIDDSDESKLCDSYVDIKEFQQIQVMTLISKW